MSMANRQKIVLIIPIIALIASCNLYAETRRKSPDSNIDVLLVMDSSGSMKKTDPHNIRMSAARLFITLLGDMDRAGIVDFSEKSNLLISLTPLYLDIYLEDLFKVIDRISSKGRYTNLYDAVKVAYEVFPSDKAAQLATPIVILMSDGQMDTGDREKDKQLIETMKRELLPGVGESGIRVFTIAFTEQSDKSLLKEIANRTTGQFYLALDERDLHGIFISILETLKTLNKLPLSENSFIVDESIKELTIAATKDKSGTQIVMESPDNKKYMAHRLKNNMKWHSTQVFDMITIKNPAKGKWTIHFSSGKNNGVYIVTNLELVTNFVQSYYYVKTDVPIEAWLERDSELIEEKKILTGSVFYAEIIQPDRNLIKLSLFDEGEDMDKNSGDGIYTNLYAPPVKGRYKIRIVTKGLTFEREITREFNVLNLEKIEEPDRREHQSKRKMVSENQTTDSPQRDDEVVEFSVTDILINFALINILFIVFGYAYYLVYGRRFFLKNIARKILARDHWG